MYTSPLTEKHRWPLLFPMLLFSHSSVLLPCPQGTLSGNLHFSVSRFSACPVTVVTSWDKWTHFTEHSAIASGKSAAVVCWKRGGEVLGRG